MKITASFFTKKFANTSKKDAYMDAAKWIASNVIKHQDELGETLFNITEVKDADFPTYKVTLYCMMDEEERKEKFCNICKQYHKSFFINEEFNCSRCNMLTYRQRCEESLGQKKSYRRERIKFRIDKGNL